MKTAFVFSGQGAQYNKMAYDFYTDYASVREKFDLASNLLNVDLAEICFGDDDRIHSTPFTQPAILTVSHAIETILKDKGISPDVVAGLSLGEYTALVSAGALTFEDAVPLVHKRGTYMEEAVPRGEGTMAAVIGMDAVTLNNLCESVSEQHYVTIANYNTPNQLVISGVESGVKEVMAKALDEGAKKTIELNVSGPFHSELLKPASELFQEDLKNVTFSTFHYPVYSNVTAMPYPDIHSVNNLLTAQIHSSVKFEQMINQMISDGVTTFIEIGPGKTLRSFIKSISRKVTVKNVEKVKQLDTVLDMFND